MSELSEFQRLTGEWAATTFNRDNKSKSLLSILTYLKKEIRELEEMFSTPFPHSYVRTGEELADCFIMLLDIAHLTSFDLLDEARKKMIINRRRKWGKPDKDGVVEHIP